MAPKAKGGVVFDPTRKDPTFAGRVRYKGRRMSFGIGTLGEGMTHAKAREIVDAVVQDAGAGREVPFLERRLTPQPRNAAVADNPLSHACMYQRRLIRLIQLALERGPANPEPVQQSLLIAQQLGEHLGQALRIN